MKSLLCTFKQGILYINLICESLVEWFEYIVVCHQLEHICDVCATSTLLTWTTFGVTSDAVTKTNVLLYILSVFSVFSVLSVPRVLSVLMMHLEYSVYL